MKIIYISIMLLSSCAVGSNLEQEVQFANDGSVCNCPKDSCGILPNGCNCNPDIHAVNGDYCEIPWYTCGGNINYANSANNICTTNCVINVSQAAQCPGKIDVQCPAYVYKCVENGESGICIPLPGGTFPGNNSLCYLAPVSLDNNYFDYCCPTY